MAVRGRAGRASSRCGFQISTPRAGADGHHLALEAGLVAIRRRDRQPALNVARRPRRPRGASSRGRLPNTLRPSVASAARRSADRPPRDERIEHEAWDEGRRGQHEHRAQGARGNARARRGDPSDQGSDRDDPAKRGSSRSREALHRVTHSGTDFPHYTRGLRIGQERPAHKGRVPGAREPRPGVKKAHRLPAPSCARFPAAAAGGFVPTAVPTRWTPRRCSASIADASARNTCRRARLVGRDRRRIRRRSRAPSAASGAAGLMQLMPETAAPVRRDEPLRSRTRTSTAGAATCTTSSPLSPQRLAGARRIQRRPGRRRRRPGHSAVRRNARVRRTRHRSASRRARPPWPRSPAFAPHRSRRCARPCACRSSIAT